MAHPQQYLFHPYETYGEELMRKSVRIPCPSYQGSTFPRWGKPSDGSAGVAADFINGDVKIFAIIDLSMVLKTAYLESNLFLLCWGLLKIATLQTYI